MLSSLLSGAAGALALNAVHEGARRVLPRAPRVDRLGEALVVRAAGRSAPEGDERYALALAGDLASNAAYYALVGAGDARTAPQRGAVLGLAAGVGAVTLPPLLGLPTAPVRRTAATAALTVAWYTLGGLVAGVTYRAVAA